MGELTLNREENEEGVDAEGKEMSYEEKVNNCNPIAHPMAPKKLTKKIYKCIKKGNYLLIIN